MAESPTYPNLVKTFAKNIVNSDGTAWLTVYVNTGQKSSRVEALHICSDDTATVNVQFGVQISGTTYLLGTARAVTLSGTDGAAIRVNAGAIVGTLAADGLQVIELGPGVTLMARTLASVTSGKTVTITGWARTFE